MKRLAILLLLSALVLSCHKNLPPVIESLTAEPDSVFPGDTVVLSFAANPGEAEGLYIHFEWSAQSGKLFNPTEPEGSTFHWIAPREPGLYYIRLAVNDDEFTVSDSILVTVKDTAGTFTDSRDGHVYKWVRIGKQIWMAENLAFLPEVYPGKVGSMDTALYYVYDYEGYDVSLAKQTENYRKYGVLYNWMAASGGEGNSSSIPSGIRGVCPPGWHLPSIDEFSMLLIPHSQVHTDLLSESGWYGENNGTNKKGFNVFPGGYRATWGGDFIFCEEHFMALFWTSTDNYLYWRSEAYVSVVRFIPSPVVGGHDPWSRWDEGLSVRCVKDE